MIDRCDCVLMVHVLPSGIFFFFMFFFFFQAEDGIRDLVRSRGLGDVYKRQYVHCVFLYSDASSYNLSMICCSTSSLDNVPSISINNWC